MKEKIAMKEKSRVPYEYVVRVVVYNRRGDCIRFEHDWFGSTCREKHAAVVRRTRAFALEGCYDLPRSGHGEAEIFRVARVGKSFRVDPVRKVTP